jgi:hypothetical protein
VGENELYDEQDWVGYRSLAFDVGRAKDTFEQTG